MRLARRLLTVALFVGLLVLGWRFAGANAAPVSVDYLLGRLEGVATWLALFLSFSVGAVVVALLGIYQMARLGMTTRHYRRTVQDLEAEVHQLRNLPLVADEPDLAHNGAPEQALERGS